MDKKRAAIVASAGVGLLVSAFVLHKWQHKRRSGMGASDESMDVHAVVEGEHVLSSARHNSRKRVADGV